MKIIALQENQNGGYSTDKFLIEATAAEIHELASLGEKAPITIGMKIEINATRARLNAIKNIKVGENYNSVLQEVRALLSTVEAIDKQLVTLTEDAKVINT